MSGRRYQIYDVFTDRPLAGNPLAIVHDCDGLDSEAMQRIAREFNLSETVFILQPRDRRHTAAIRIFSPNFEMPFAGHPTVGTAIALAAERMSGADALIVLEEKIGDVRCAVTHGAAAFAEFDLPEQSVRLDLTADAQLVAAALGLAPLDIGFENHRPGCWSAGVPYVTVPVSGPDAVARARLDPALWARVAPPRGNGVPASAYVYCRMDGDSAFRARMFTGGLQTYEDPATGSALAAFSGTVLAFDRPPDGGYGGWIEQGIEMGRPSRLRLEIEVSGGRALTTRVGGHAVLVGEGRLFI